MSELLLERPLEAEEADLAHYDMDPVATAIGNVALQPLSTDELRTFASNFTPPQGKATEAPFNSAVDMPQASFQSFVR